MAPTVLVVEADEILRSLTVEAISLLGVCVIDCASADDALAMLDDSTSIALVITDLHTWQDGWAGVRECDLVALAMLACHRDVWQYIGSKRAVALPVNAHE
ncbi:hypothetical protein [Pseudomonas donghuensis]|uniref:hypothetical protein n=1 Tax=Pseudomonas donghuensis TaxID=1163398 RepID=UPI0020C3CEFB|nr:hypothetical protein [Pseudomonas donghuensis]MBF4211189.1 hypothetical protein [Pseudomonas donghuensis]MCP6697691.1 hypothetical protein [Pseudomonas donghuensis]